MKKLNDLLQLEKIHVVKTFALYDYIADVEDAENNTRKRILQSRIDNRYFYNEMKDGEAVKCFEIALEWEPFPGVKIFVYTPDDIHVCSMDSRTPGVVEYRKIENVKPGMYFLHNGIKIAVVDENTIAINGRNVKVEKDSAYVFKCLKSKIKADNGAFGFFAVLEQNENNQFSTLYADKIIEKYAI